MCKQFLAGLLCWLLACCIQSTPMTINACSSCFLLLLSAFYTWHKAEPISKAISVYALFFPHKKLLLFLIIANLSDIHHVTCLFNVFHFIYSLLEIIISLLLVQQNNWSCGSQNSPEQDSLHRHYVNTVSKDLGNTIYSSLARILRWFCTGSNFLHSKCYCHLYNHFLPTSLHSVHEGTSGRKFLSSPSSIAGGCPYWVRMTTPKAQHPTSDAGQLDT